MLQLTPGSKVRLPDGTPATVTKMPYSGTRITVLDANGITRRPLMGELKRFKPTFKEARSPHVRQAKRSGDGDMIDDGLVGDGCHRDNVDPERFFAVIRLSDGAMIYRGQDMEQVAFYAEQGTAWREAKSQFVADRAAREYRRNLIAAKNG